MLWTLCVVLLILWALGSFAPFSPVRGNNLVHVILVVFLVLVLIQVLGGGGLHLRR
jgi:Family of unknown function (DUF5670)